MRALFCGSRNWTDGVAIAKTIATLGPDWVVVHGAAKGADSLAGRVAGQWDLAVERFPAKWQEHHPDWCPGEWCQKRGYCVGAGPRRNQQMLDEAEPDVCFAFKDGFDVHCRKGGTEDMVRRASLAGLPVQLHHHERLENVGYHGEHPPAVAGLYVTMYHWGGE